MLQLQREAWPTPAHAHWHSTQAVADLGGVPRVPEPPLVELDIGQAGRWLRRCACMLLYVCKSCVRGVRMPLSRVAASSWSSSLIHHERVDKPFVLWTSATDHFFSSVESVGSDLEVPSPSQMDTATVRQHGGCYLC